MELLTYPLNRAFTVSGPVDQVIAFDDAKLLMAEKPRNKSLPTEIVLEPDADALRAWKPLKSIVTIPWDTIEDAAAHWITNPAASQVKFVVTADGRRRDFSVPGHLGPYLAEVMSQRLGDRLRLTADSFTRTARNTRLATTAFFLLMAAGTAVFIWITQGVAQRGLRVHGRGRILVLLIETSIRTIGLVPTYLLELTIGIGLALLIASHKRRKLRETPSDEELQAAGYELRD